MKLKLSFILIVFFITINAQSKHDLNSERIYFKIYISIRTLNPEEKDNSDLQILNKLIGNSAIVGLGEATHGSSEVYQMKYRISEYLIAHKNFNVFSLKPICLKVF
jgi:erythromycin esterase